MVTGKADGCIKTEIYDDGFENIFAYGVSYKTIRLGGGHWVHYENHEDFNRHVLNFLLKKP